VPAFSAVLLSSSVASRAPCTALSGQTSDASAIRLCPLVIVGKPSDNHEMKVFRIIRSTVESARVHQKAGEHSKSVLIYARIGLCARSFDREGSQRSLSKFSIAISFLLCHTAVLRHFDAEAAVEGRPVGPGDVRRGVPNASSAHQGIDRGK